MTGLALCCLAYGFLIEPTRLVVRELNIKSPHWQGAEIRIALISDIHVGGRHVDAARTKKIAERVNAQSPDLVLIAGDFASELAAKPKYSPAEIEDLNAGLLALGALMAPLGVFAVLGNHDYLYDPNHVQSMLEAGGIVFVDNRSEIAGNRLCVFGFGDDYYGKPNRKGRDACGPELPMIGLMHNPDSFELARGGEALMAAGHTHGGQVNIPGIGRRKTATRGGPKYAYGEIDVNGTPAFVTAGIGMSMLSARFNAPPEIVMITLKAEPS